MGTIKIVFPSSTVPIMFILAVTKPLTQYRDSRYVEKFDIYFEDITRYYVDIAIDIESIIII